MDNKNSEIYKQKINHIKSKVQNEYYVHNSNESSSDFENKKISKEELILKINNIFNSPNYVYQADITIMFKNNENKRKKVIGYKNNYLLTIDGEKIFIDDIYDIK